jgi:WD40 repeat protein
MSPNLKNPYVGPRTFQREDRDLFFGRDREARDLMALIASERLILFYAQSGAGKSSLLNTRLLPELEENNFEVLPVGRLQGESPAGVEVENIYIYNLMSSLVQKKFAPESLATISLSQFLAVLEFHDGGCILSEESLTEIIQEPRWPRVLIIDQFEELFTTHLYAWKKREDFFCQLAQAMRDDPYLTVILIMRDDYIASLDPYAHLLPGGLRIRYYMQRLGWESALKAVKNPAANSRPYAKGVAERLVDDLASLTIQKPDGSQEILSGQYVEPVQLQVVCYGLWDDLPPDRDEITANDLLEVGDVDQSLERYYDKRMAAIAGEKNTAERWIREWFEKELITSSRTRNMVLQNTTPNAKLNDDVIQTMRGDLVRAELRAGQIWYELSHDRLIDPVLASNVKWFEEHLSMFQRRVVLWIQQGKSESLLLRDQELEEAEREAATLSLTAEEGEFLEDCRILRKREARDRTQRRVIIFALIISLVLLGVAVYSYLGAETARNEAEIARNEAVVAQGKAEEQKDQADKARVEAVLQKSNAETQRRIAEEQARIAEDQANKALAGSLAAQANSLKNNDHALALLLGVEAYQREQSLLTKKTLFDLLQFTAYKRADFPATVSSAAVSPDGEWIAVSSCKDKEAGDCKVGDIQLFNGTLEKPADVPREYGVVYSLAFHQDGDQLTLAAGGCVPEGCSEAKGQITLWAITPSDAMIIDQIPAHTNLVKTLAFSPDGKHLASGSYDTTVFLWDLSSPGSPQNINTRLDHESFVNEIAFSPDGNHLVSAGDDHAIYVWAISDKDKLKDNVISQPSQKYDEVYTTPVTSIAFSPDGQTFASAGYDSLIRLWDWNAGALTLQTNKILAGHTGYVTSIAFNADGSLLASAGFDNTILLWDTRTGQQLGPPLSGHTKAINHVTFGSFFNDGAGHPYLISVGNDQIAIQWDLFTRNPLSRFLDFADPENTDLISRADEWQDTACEAAKRNLTQAEWDQFLPNQPYEETCPGID